MKIKVRNEPTKSVKFGSFEEKTKTCGLCLKTFKTKRERDSHAKVCMGQEVDSQ